MRALEVGDHPAVQSADNLVRDLDMPGRDPAVERDAEVSLGAADDEPMIANADGLAVGLAVVKDRQHSDRRPHRRAERDCGRAAAGGGGAGIGAGGSTATGGPGCRPL